MFRPGASIFGMSIRTRMLVLFLALAVVPLLILGAVASSLVARVK